jgi:hypothetical protein
MILLKSSQTLTQRSSFFSESHVNIQLFSTYIFFFIQFFFISKDETKFVKFILGLSVYTNTKKLFKTSTHEREEVKCLHAIRVLSLGKLFIQRKILGLIYSQIIFSQLGLLSDIAMSFRWVNRV